MAPHHGGPPVVSLWGDTPLSPLWGGAMRCQGMPSGCASWYHPRNDISEVGSCREPPLLLLPDHDIHGILLLPEDMRISSSPLLVAYPLYPNPKGRYVGIVIMLLSWVVGTYCLTISRYQRIVDSCFPMGIACYRYIRDIPYMRYHGRAQEGAPSHILHICYLCTMCRKGISGVQIGASEPRDSRSGLS